MDEISEIVPATISKNLRKKLCQVSDANCILFKFFNKDEDAFAIGFTAWLKKNKIKDMDLHDLVESQEEVLMYWPINIAIKPAKMLSKFLANAQFSEEPVILKSYGDWISMKKQLKTLETVGRLDISKNSRKNVMKKIDASPIKSKVKKDKFFKSAKAAAAQDQVQEIMKTRANMPLVHQPFRWENIDKSDEEESDITEFNNSRTHDSGLGNSVNSTAYVSARMNQKRVLACSDDNENQTGSQIKRGRKNIKKSKTHPTDESSPPATPSPTPEQNSPQRKKSKKTRPTDESSLPATLPPPPKEYRPNDEFEDFYFSNESDTEYPNFERNVEKERRSSAIGLGAQGHSRGSNLNLPAGVKRAPPLPDSIIKMCYAKKKIQSFVSGLADNFFEKSYLAEHSPTGQTPNIFQMMNIVPKPPLYPPIVKYIRELVTAHFGSQVGVQGKVTKALSDKIASARPKKQKQPNAGVTGDE